MAAKWREWAKDRFGLETLRKHALDRRVAKSPWYYGDGATLVLLLAVLVLTGVAMAFTYSPSPDAAYASVQHLTEEQTLGGFVRALHYWAAGLMVVMLVFHLFRQILVAGYKSPREGTWLVGVFLFFAVIVMSFTGYVLRWDERSVYALRVALHMFWNVPVIGESLVMLVQGGPELGGRALTRIFAVHVIAVPLLLLFLVSFHLYLVMLHGVTSRGERRQPVHSAEEQRELYRAQAESKEEGETFHPHTTFKSGLMASVVLGIVVLLALVAGPAQLYPEANLVETSFPVEEWWFWWYSALIALLPSWLAPSFYVLFPVVLFLVLAALPFVDRSPYRGIRKRPLAAAIVLVCLIGLVYLTDLRRRSPWTGWPGAEPPPVPAGFILAPEAEAGRRLFARFGCNSCHPVAGEGRQFAVDLALAGGRLSREEIREYVLQPPEGIAMPAYEGRLNDDDLERIVEYVHVAQTFPRD